MCFGVAMANHIDPHSHISAEAQELAELLDFAPVPMKRQRFNGWNAERQRRFITALSVMGAVGPAARAVGMGRGSAYRLRERAGAEGFAEAWDIALATGVDAQYYAALDLAVNGTTTVRVMRGGSVDVMTSHDRKLLNAALFPRNSAFGAIKATRETR